MLNVEHHMLDTNIILAIILPNDNSYNDVKKYLETAFLRYISENTRYEAENKIKNIKKVSFDISEHVQNHSLKHSINYLNMHKETLIAKQNFLKKFKNKELPVNMPRKRFNNLVNELFNNYEDQITLILITNDNEELNDLIIDSFIENIINLSDFVDK